MANRMPRDNAEWSSAIKEHLLSIRVCLTASESSGLNTSQDRLLEMLLPVIVQQSGFALNRHITEIPLTYSFWLMLAFYVVHVLDESLLGGGFVENVKEHWWPQYSWRKFFWLNAGYLRVMSASIVLYDHGGNAFLSYPLLGPRSVLRIAFGTCGGPSGSANILQVS